MNAPKRRCRIPTKTTLSLSLLGSWFLVVGCTATVSDQPKLKNTLEAQNGTATSVSSEEVVLPKETLPSKIALDVPFASQAPLGDWDDPYQEACEEMSLITADYYLRGLRFTPEQANREILQLTAWEGANGYKEDVTIAELAEIAEEYYGYDARISDDVTLQSITQEIAKGNPVIVPAAGRDLGNPYYSGEGPWYHMLVITGFTRRNFIVNDVGTKRGEGYVYRHRVLLDAIHDWTGVKEEIRNGPKRMLILEKN